MWREKRMIAGTLLTVPVYALFVQKHEMTPLMYVKIINYMSQNCGLWLFIQLNMHNNNVGITEFIEFKITRAIYQRSLFISSFKTTPVSITRFTVTWELLGLKKNILGLQAATHLFFGAGLIWDISSFEFFCFFFFTFLWTCLSK